MVIFYKIWKKYNEIQLTKKQMDLHIRKMTYHPPIHDNLNIINKQNMVVFYKIRKNYNEKSFTLPR